LLGNAVGRAANFLRGWKTFKGNQMIKLGCLLAALASVALVSPSVAGDTPAPPFETARRGVAPNDDVKANDARSGTMRPNGERAGPRTETRRGEHRAVAKGDPGVAGTMHRRQRHHRQHREM
jgi:hypothetical protein